MGTESLNSNEKQLLAALLEKFLRGAGLQNEEAALFFENGKRHAKKPKSK